MSAWTRWLNLFRGPRLDREFDDEFRFHLECRVADLVQRGASPAEAAAEAARRFGNTALVKREMREVRMMSIPKAIVAASGAALIVIGTVFWFGWSRMPQPAFYRLGDRGVERPSPIHQPPPQYTPEAMQAKIQGTVMVECIVKPTGLCEDIQIARSLDPSGLDQQAIKAVQAWRFNPGKRKGEPVPVIVNIEMAFRLR
jgi:TonB family protein